MSSAGTRRHWLDWQRGLAVLLMVEVHVLDAWLDPAVPRGTLHHVLRMLGGFAAPSFLYMAGLSQVLADASQARKGVPSGVRLRGALRRALWLLGVAYAFRVGEYVLGAAWLVPGGWRDILRVDILNVIALSLAVTAALAIAPPARWRAPLLALAAIALALAAPALLALPRTPGPLVDYLLPAARGGFAAVSWTAFALAGALAGRLLEKGDRPWSFVAAGAALVFAGWAADRFGAPMAAPEDFWHASPAWLAMRLGFVVAASGVLQLVPAGLAGALSGLSLLGRHSLLGYMASVELTYGLATKPLHHALGTGGVLAGIAAAVLATAALCVVAERRAYPWAKASRSTRASAS